MVFSNFFKKLGVLINTKLIIFLYIPLMVLLLAYKPKKAPEGKREAILQIAMQALTNIHYSPQEINDEFSKKVFDLYLKRLDGNKFFLTQGDVDQLKKFETKIDDEIKAGSFEFFDLASDLLTTRINEDEAFYKEILDKPFDFNQDENFEGDPKKTTFASSKDQLKEVWRKYLKYQTLIRLDELTQSQEKAKEKSDTVKTKTPVQLEEEARKKVLKSQKELFKRIHEIDKDERYADYINTIANVYDPHTEYYPAKEKANFDISMTGQLEGIGAQLQEKDGNIKVSSIVPGSASYRQGQLKAGDIILKVAQGAAEPVDISDMRIDNVVTLVRGKKGTEVRLTVKKADGTIHVISIIRDIVVIEETYAKSAIINGKKKIGYIRLPIFYTPNQQGGRSSAEDVKREILKLKKEGVEGIVLDLRDNGGGSLQDVVDMAGLFIEKGPIVQVKSKDGSPSVLEDTDQSLVYDGPLVVMVNSNSASASEILAAAIQDYRRGIIIGGNSTYGKGTVQRFFNLDDYLNQSYASVKPLGSIKITTQKFYRINGGATQLKGVIPDINLPDPYSTIESGEKDQDDAMAWDEIAAVKYNLWKSDINIDKIKKASKQRVQASPAFKLISEQADRLKSQKDKSLISLNLKKYTDEQKRNKEEAKKFDALTKENAELSFNNLGVDIPQIEQDSAKVTRNKEWLKNLKKDPYLLESTSVLNDLK